MRNGMRMQYDMRARTNQKVLKEEKKKSYRKGKQVGSYTLLPMRAAFPDLMLRSFLFWKYLIVQGRSSIASRPERLPQRDSGIGNIQIVAAPFWPKK